MVCVARHRVSESDLIGFKYFKRLMSLLGRLHDHGCERDRAGNRRLHYDQYLSLILLYLFNPVVISLRGLSQASGLRKVQRVLGCPRASLGSLSEAARVFDARLLGGLIDQLSGELSPHPHGSGLDDTGRLLTLVDGTVLAALPRLAWALLGVDKPRHDDSLKRRFKLHVQIEPLRAEAVAAVAVTPATVGERSVLRPTLEPGRLYVLDRGYAEYDLMGAILERGSSFLVRLPDNATRQLIHERPLTDEARRAGVLSDRLVSAGSPRRRGSLDQPLRVIEVAAKPHKQHWRYVSSRGGPHQGDRIVLATDRLDLDADLVALIYRQRWAVEVFFRMLKHLLGCRHLLSHHPNGITIQCYTAIIACLLIALWTGRKPTRRTYEMACFYFNGLAEAQEFDAHIAALPRPNTPDA
jgi:hypothetical protein